MAREPGERRERILASAAGLFARKGVSATTVREIADEVGMLSGSLYHHFDSKEAMVDEIVASYLEDLRVRYKAVVARDTDPRAKLHDLIVASLEVVESHPHATEIYQNEVNYLQQIERFGYLKNAGKEVQSTWLEVINAGVRDNVFRADLDPKVLYRLMRDAVWLSVRWFKPTRDYPVSRFAEDCVHLFVDGLAAKG
jgi:TetR/AcrR family transcriptional regulator, cholesterol catabolism regulator